MNEMMTVDSHGKKTDGAETAISLDNGAAIGCGDVAAYAYGCNYATQCTPSNYNITRRR